jgi:RHS repeat-associated protein
MVMPGRKFSATTAKNYRFGFNGKENDNEVKGEGGQVDYGMRIYDPRLAKFLSVDPLQEEYSELTPYQFASNRPIDGVDLDGEEWLPAIKWLEKRILGSNHIEKIEAGFIKRGAELVIGTLHGVKEEIKNLPQINPATGGVSYARIDPKNFQKSKEMLESIGKAIVDDYVGLFNRAANGDDEAIGGVVFELAMLVVPIPGAAESKGLSAAAKGVTTAEKLIFLSEKTIVRELTESPIEVIDQALLKSGWERLPPVKESENAIVHTIYTKTSKSGKIYKLDYHPGGGIHQGPYWKGSYQKPATGKFINRDIDLFRIGKDLKKADKIKTGVYSNGKKIGGTKSAKEVLKK